MFILKKGNKIKIFVIFLFSFLLVSCISANAATLYTSPTSGKYDIGKSFAVSVFVAPKNGEVINAVSGSIKFPKDKIEILSISKSSSIINFWVQDPIFSNLNGSIDFEGVVLNPGFSGKNGNIITINFKTKNSGLAKISFSSGAVLANDGNGTNILSGFDSSEITVEVKASEKVEPKIENNIKPDNQEKKIATTSLVIKSSTHPDQNSWYNNKNQIFSFLFSDKTKAIRLLYSNNSNSQPLVEYNPAINFKKIEEAEDGIWYMNAQIDTDVGWEPVTSYKLNIDSTPPDKFLISVDGDKNNMDGNPRIYFKAEDSLSGIHHYEVKIDNKEAIILPVDFSADNYYQLPEQSIGKKQITVTAFDNAGNQTSSSESIIVTKNAQKIPEIIEYDKNTYSSRGLNIKGFASPNTKIIFYAYKSDDGIISTSSVYSAEDGSFTFEYSNILSKGYYEIWVVSENENGVLSSDSERIIVEVLSKRNFFFKKYFIGFLNWFSNLSVEKISLLINLLFALLFVYIFRENIKFKRRLKDNNKLLESIIKKGSVLSRKGRLRKKS